MSIEKILIVEDNESLGNALEEHLRNNRFDVTVAKRLSAAREHLNRDSVDLVLLDLRLPDGAGLELLQELQQKPQRPLTVVMTGHGTVKSAVECMHHGAFDYLTKPFTLEELDMAIAKSENLSKLVSVTRYLSHERDDELEGVLLGTSSAMQQLRDLIRRVARTEAAVLIQGESGTGKELVARELYRQSPRAEAPFIRVNCAAIPENLIESEFFGHEKGAFTGAISKREGRFELAHGGTILLDEVSEIAPTIQAKLLRVLQEKEFERVGGTRTIKVNVRVIATTNRNLEESIANKEFRQDLYFRLNVVPIHVPPLRERQDDIALLAEHFVRRFGRKHGVQVRGLGPECLDSLRDHAWPGNVRELQNVIERAVILCEQNEVLRAEHLGFSAAPPAFRASTSAAAKLDGTPVSSTGDFPTLGELEKRHILAALERCADNRTHAARLLDISIRTLRNKLNDYGVKPRVEAASRLPALEDRPQTANDSR